MSMIGLRVGPFEITREAVVPEGGQWFRAARAGTARRTPNDVLVRLLSPDAPAEERAGLQREYETLRELEDARLPQPVAFYEGIGALAVTAVEGAPLRMWIADRRAEGLPLTPATLLDIALDLAEVLQHAHNKGRFHGRLSPDVVVIGADGRLCLWGMAPGSAPEADPAWLAPERARSEPPGPHTDQWALAALIAALVTGREPWESDPGAQARRGDTSALLEPIERQWPALGRILRRALDPHPANRFPSLHPLRQELLALARKAGGASDRRDLAAQLARRMPIPVTLVEEDEPPAADAPDEPQTAADAATPTSASASATTPDAATPPTTTPPTGTPAATAPAGIEMPTAATIPSPDATPTPDATRTPDATPTPAATAGTPAPRPRREALTAEPLPVVRVELEDEVPLAVKGDGRARTDRPAPPRVAAPDEIAHDEPVVAEATEERAPTEVADEADLEPSAPTMIVDNALLKQLMDGASPAAADEETTGSNEPTAAYDPNAHRAYEDELVMHRTNARSTAIVEYDDEDDDDDNEEATSVFDGAFLGLHASNAAASFAEDGAEDENDRPRPTAVPVTDPDVDDEVVHDPPSEEGATFHRPLTKRQITGVPDDDDELQVMPHGPLREPLEEPEPSSITRVAPWIAGVMIAGFLLLAIWRTMA